MAKQLKIMRIITFYKPGDAYGEFSNFSRHPIEMDGKTWPSVEHYFQAQKFKGSEHEEEIRQLPSPMEAKISGTNHSKPLRQDWEAVKEKVMRNAIYAKFTQHSELRKLLLSTGDSLLVEASKSDSFWGAGPTGNGRNTLGLILMEVRQLLSEP